MRIPIFEEILVTDFEIENLIALFRKKKVARPPMYIGLYNFSYTETMDKIQNISLALKALDMHPYFPYPFYVITKFKILDSPVPVATNVEELPQNYFKKIKRLKTKELNLLNKGSMVAEKVANSDIYRKIRDLQNSLKGQKQLFLISKETHFYNTVLDKISKAQKDQL